MKRLIPLLLCLLLILPVGAKAPKVVDNANLLTGTQAARLEQTAQNITDTYSMDVVIVTVNSLGGKSSQAYADDYYDNNGYGIGPRYSGVLLLVCMTEREVAISTCGDAIDAISDREIDRLLDTVIPYLSESAYYDGFCAYLEELEICIEGTSTEFGIGNILIALLIGAAVGGIVLWIMRSKMNTAKPQSGAQNYIVSGSYDLYRCQDFYLYSRTSRVRKAENNSSTHRSSSGRSHGGGSRRF